MTIVEDFRCVAATNCSSVTYTNRRRGKHVYITAVLTSLSCSNCLWSNTELYFSDQQYSIGVFLCGECKVSQRSEATKIIISQLKGEFDIQKCSFNTPELPLQSQPPLHSNARRCHLALIYFGSELIHRFTGLWLCSLLWEKHLCSKMPAQRGVQTEEKSPLLAILPSQRWPAQRLAHGSGEHTDPHWRTSVLRALHVPKDAAEADCWKQTGTLSTQQHEVFDILHCLI